MDISKSDKKAWVLKVPTSIANSWKDASKKGEVVAKVRIEETDGKVTNASMHLLGEYKEDLSKNFNINYREITGLQLLRKDENKSSHEGSVIKLESVIMTPMKGQSGKIQVDEKFLRNAGDKNKKEKEKIRDNVVPVLDYQDSDRIIRPPPITSLQEKRRRELLNMRTSMKRARMEKDDLEKILFSLFETQKYWRFPHLQMRTEQPTKWLREVLSEIAVVVRTGEFIGMYELKPEYNRNR